MKSPVISINLRRVVIDGQRHASSRSFSGSRMNGSFNFPQHRACIAKAFGVDQLTSGDFRRVTSTMVLTGLNE